MLDVALAEIWRSLDGIPESDCTADWAVATNYYDVYRAIGRILQPESVLEIGTRLGQSLLSMVCDSLQTKHISFIDNETYVSGSNEIARANLLQFYEKFVPGRRVPTIEVFGSLPNPVEIGCPVALAHVDGEHTFEGKIRDLDFCLAVGAGMVLVDDFDYHGCCREAVVSWSSQHNVDLHYLQTFRGMALMELVHSGGISALSKTVALS
jgi:hypothetical protein